ncbi:MAG: excisionase family DNA-binding protein [Clostridiaceae bacterium]
MANIKPTTFTAQEAADYIGISYWLVLEMAKKHEIPVISCGSRKLFRKEAIDKWMDEKEKQSMLEDHENMPGVLRKIY